MANPLEVVIKRTASNPAVAGRVVKYAKTEAEFLKEASAVTSSNWLKEIKKYKFFNYAQDFGSGFRSRFSVSLHVNRRKLQPLVAPVSGFLAAFAEISLLFPTEYCKVQMQLNRGNAAFNLVDHLKERRFKIYQGLPPMLIGAPLQGLLRFSCLDIVSNSATLKSITTSPAISGLLAGVCAGVVESVLVVTPMETIKTKLIDSKRGLVDGTRYVLRTQGIAGLYNGLMPTICKSASNQAIRFIVFNQYKNYVTQGEPRKLTIGESLSGGILAGLIGCLLNTPVDTVKSRMQSLERSKYKNSIDCVRQMVKHEGFSSLYKGLVMRSARVVPGQGIIFVVYEQISGSLNSMLE